MKLKLKKPSRGRDDALGTALGALGTAIGALPVTVRPGRRTGPSAVRIAVPVTLLAVVVASVARRRRRAAAVEPYAGAPAEECGAVAVTRPPEEPKTETEREKDRETDPEAATEAQAATETGQTGGNGTAS